MQISLKWVNELVNIETIHLEELIEKLTLGGFEVEEIFELEINGQKEIALDVSATANRSDSLSIQGISLEIAALLNKPCKVSKYSTKNLDWKSKIDSLYSMISNNHNCSTFITVIVENLTDFSVPKWLKQKLISSGLNPVNNLLDFQTYILLETGYPFEFYDLDKIYSKLNSEEFNLTITNSNNKEMFSASNNIEYQLETSISLIKANELPISIA